jgi:polar amino acid transport system substrate-binding protein
MELVIEDMEFDAVVMSVGKNGIDVAAAALTVNETRKESVNFSTTYYNAAQVLIVLENNTAFDACTSADDVIAKLVAENNK